MRRRSPCRPRPGRTAPSGRRRARCGAVRSVTGRASSLEIRTSIQLTSSPHSQVAVNSRGGSQVRIVPWRCRPARSGRRRAGHRRSAGTTAGFVDVGAGVPEVGGIGVVRLTDRDDARLPRLQRPVADGAPHGVDLVVHVNHVALPSSLCAFRGRPRSPARRDAASRTGGIRRATRRHHARRRRSPHTVVADPRAVPT